MKIVPYTVHTKRINFNKVSLNLGDKLRIHEPVNIALDMGLPLGTVKDMVVETSMHTNCFLIS